MLQEIEKIFKKIESTRQIKSFFSKQEEYKDAIESSIRSGLFGKEVKFLGLFEDARLFDSGSLISAIKKNLYHGCHIKILLLHPESILFECLIKAGYINSSRKEKGKFRKRMHGTLPDKLEDLKIQLQKDYGPNIKGSIEIRVHKDMFSPIGYYSDGRDNNFIWMYFSTGDEGIIEYPGFSILEDDSFAMSSDKHFDCLWEKTTPDDIILKIGRDIRGELIKIVYDADRIFGENF
jgi:hypothetical protein